MKAYHIDRSKKLIPNQILELNKSISLDPKYLEDFMNYRYPAGLSSHGDTHFASISNPVNTGNVVSEAIIEYERMLNFPNALSRYQSIFCIKEENDLKKWIELFGNPDTYNILEVDTLNSKVQEYDSNFLNGGDISVMNRYSVLRTAYDAKFYWNGSLSQTPRMECLVSPRIKILRRVKVSEIV